MRLVIFSEYNILDHFTPVSLSVIAFLNTILIYREFLFPAKYTENLLLPCIYRELEKAVDSFLITCCEMASQLCLPFDCEWRNSLQ